MVFESFLAARASLLAIALLLGGVLGYTMARTNFCTLGALSDWVNMGDTRRLRAWLLAIAIAALGLALLEPLGWVRPDDASPAYRSAELAWGAHLLGGLLFGAGMALASGCGSKTALRIGTGSLKALVVAAVLAVTVYAMLNPLPGLDRSLDEWLFTWLQAATVSLGHPQDLASFFGGSPLLRGLLAGAVALALLALVFAARDFRSSARHIAGGTVVGLCVLGLWVASSVFLASDPVFGDRLTLPEFVTDWGLLGDQEPLPPPASARAVAPQGISLIGPFADTGQWVAGGFPTNLVTTGIAVLLGVILGALAWALRHGRFRLERFASGGDLAAHLSGGVLMGIGGALAAGCTFGQGITGVSTLALGAWITLPAMMGGAVATLVLQYRWLLARM